MRKKLSFSDVGLDCSYMVTASTEELVMETALKHMSKVHIKKPEEITPELKAKMMANIKVEQGSL